MIFKANEDQIKVIAVNAINASLPGGLGCLRLDFKDYAASDVDFDRKGNINIDYFRGRMVKLWIIKVDDDTWKTVGLTGTPKKQYQSWVRKYPTFKDLAATALVMI